MDSLELVCYSKDVACLVKLCGSPSSCGLRLTDVFGFKSAVSVFSVCA